MKKPLARHHFAMPRRRQRAPYRGHNSRQREGAGQVGVPAKQGLERGRRDAVGFGGLQRQRADGKGPIQSWELSRSGLWGLFRLNGTLTVERQHLIGRRQGGGRTIVEEWLVLVGYGQTAPKITLRLICLRQGKLKRDLLTNVLDPQMLMAEEALALYPLRWQIERAFFDLKVVLKLDRFYTANPNGVAMQVYGAAMVYNAFRVAQGRLAQRLGVAPEDISTAKFFPKLAQESSDVAAAEWMFLALNRKNGGNLAKPDIIAEAPFGRTTLGAILVRKREGHRRRKYFVRGRKLWKSLAHISGGQKLTKLT